MGKLVPVKDTNYQSRAYRAEQCAEATLLEQGRLLGWSSHDDLFDWHIANASGLLARVGSTAPVPVLMRGTGASSSRYYAHSHTMKVLAADRNVLAYTHELAHAALAERRGNGHHPRWAGVYLAMLRAVDSRAGAELRAEFKRARLTITHPHTGGNEQ